MFESMKNDFASNVLFGERVKTILFFSMINMFPISLLFFLDGAQKIDQATIKRGVVSLVSPGSGTHWEKCCKTSFQLTTYDDVWFDIQDLYSICLADAQNPHEFWKHELTINKLQHLGQVYTGATGRRRGHFTSDLGLDDENDTKYYKLLSYMNNK